MAQIANPTQALLADGIVTGLTSAGFTSVAKAADNTYVYGTKPTNWQIQSIMKITLSGLSITKVEDASAINGTTGALTAARTLKTTDGYGDHSDVNLNGPAIYYFGGDGIFSLVGGTNDGGYYQFFAIGNIQAFDGSYHTILMRHGSSDSYGQQNQIQEWTPVNIFGATVQGYAWNACADNIYRGTQLFVTGTQYNYGWFPKLAFFGMNSLGSTMNADTQPYYYIGPASMFSNLPVSFPW